MQATRILAGTTTKSDRGARLGSSQQGGKGEYIAALDGVRGVAILLVLFFHFGRFTRMSGGVLIDRLFLSTARVGWVGVDLFFVLSGFLITGILLEAKGKRRYFSSFYGRRVLRILPVYYATLLCILLAVHLSDIGDVKVYNRFVDTQAWYWTHLQNVLFTLRHWPGPDSMGHLWSLAVEEQFYLVWPLVVALTSRRALLRVTVACVVVAFLARGALSLANVEPAAAYVLTFARCDALAVGAMLSVLASQPDALSRMVPHFRWSMFAAGSAIAAIWALRGGFDGLHDPIVQVFGFTALTFLFGGLLGLTIAQPTGASAQFFSHGFLRFWGRYSYALYIFHHIVGWHLMRRGLRANVVAPWFGSQLPGAVVAMVVMTVISLGLALASWHVIEKHFLRFKVYFSYG